MVGIQLNKATQLELSLFTTRLLLEYSDTI
jgi:hypothetical protein